MHDQPTTATQSGEDPHVATAVDALRLLHALGDNRDAVADMLRVLGHRGLDTAPGRCPIANYLNHRIDVHDLNVFGDIIELHFSANPDDREVVRVPDPVEAFVYAFDHGAYLDLVDGPYLPTRPTAGAAA